MLTRDGFDRFLSVMSLLFRLLINLIIVFIGGIFFQIKGLGIKNIIIILGFTVLVSVLQYIANGINNINIIKKFRDNNTW